MTSLLPTVSRPAQVRALVAPARQEIVDALETGGPCSVAALAALLGRPADGLYHHLRVLERVDLIRVVERRKVGRQVYVVYDVSVRPLVMSYEKPVRSADVANCISALQRIAMRDFRRALADNLGPTRGDDRAVWGARARGWLTPEDLRTLNRHLASATAIIRAARKPPDPHAESDAESDADAAGRRCISLQFILTPSGFTSRRAKKRTPRAKR